MRPEAVTLRRRPASPRVAGLLGVLAFVLVVGMLPLAVLAHRFTFSNVGDILLPSTAFAAVGIVVARSQPRNPLGWLLLAFGLIAALGFDAGMYAVLRYRLGDTGLPLGPLAVFLAPDWIPVLILLPLPIALFPDGRLPSRLWRATFWLYIALMATWLSLIAAVQVDGVFVRPIRVDSSGNATVLDHASGVWNTLNHLSQVLLLPYFVLAFAWVLRQFLAYRTASGERRQQIKSLMSGGAVCVLGLAADFVASNLNGLFWDVLSDVGVVAIAALPIGIGVGILKYRLYDIDRLISRTLSYAILTGLLVGVFIGIVVFATDVLPFSSPVAVAASTLAAAALFNPLRLRVQRLVDRRFNRARYDAEAIVTAFTLRLRDAVDLDTVRDELLQAVNGAVQPAYVSVWIRPPR
jgi:hypothetical protein